jgi:small-conductance mechanosensitive channel
MNKVLKVGRRVKDKLEDRIDDVKQRLEEFTIPKHWFLNRFIIILGVFYLLLEIIIRLANTGIYTLPESIVNVARGSILVVLSFLVVSSVIRLTQDWIFRFFGKESEIEQILFFKKLYAIMLYFFAIAFILYKFGVSIENITLFAGLLASGVAFAIREALISFMIWFMLLTKKPFRIGDYIKIGDDIGRVIHIGTFYVIIDEDDQMESEIIRIPNKIFLDKTVQNYGKEGIFLDTVKISFKDNPEKFLTQAREAVKELTNDPKHNKVSLDTKDDGYVLVVRYPVKYFQRGETRTKLLLKLKQ